MVNDVAQYRISKTDIKEGQETLDYIKNIFASERVRIEKEKKNHSCNDCVWAVWQGKFVYCPFAKCFTGKNEKGSKGDKNEKMESM